MPKGEIRASYQIAGDICPKIRSPRKNAGRDGIGDKAVWFEFGRHKFEPLQVPDDFPGLPQRTQLAPVEVRRMERPPTRLEVEEIVKAMNNHKACGPDGIPVGCFKHSDARVAEITAILPRAWISAPLLL